MLTFLRDLSPYKTKSLLLWKTTNMRESITMQSKKCWKQKIALSNLEYWQMSKYICWNILLYIYSYRVYFCNNTFERVIFCANMSVRDFTSLTVKCQLYDRLPQNLSSSISLTTLELVFYMWMSQYSAFRKPPVFLENGQGLIHHILPYNGKKQIWER